MAHRCAKHESYDGALNHNGPGMSECAICALKDVVDQLVLDTLAPIVIAYQAAEGALALAGARNEPKVSVLMALLDALVQKHQEGDFEVHAQRVIPNPAPTDPRKVN